MRILAASVVCLLSFPAISQEMTSYDLCVEDVYRSSVIDKAVDCHLVQSTFFKGRVNACAAGLKAKDLSKAQSFAIQTWKTDYKDQPNHCARLRDFAPQAFQDE